ncbi:MAG: bifunctional folylpolyglutamate synthase/dihydrofolate synthase [Pyrinomonadaceae bacterium]|nr:bifunctional folylpolyglutamate synthase/dihydrofolate synthase [Pyrinomonadaceae bacterium]
MQFDEALQYLLSLGHETLAIKLGLANMERLLEALGHPQRSSPSIQIAGTNGKGSTAVMLDRICREAKISSGLYTSPHLVSITERIRIGGEEITPEDFARLTTRVRDASARVQKQSGALPTFFEQVTAVAFCAFSEARVELAILETGLGGRLDATTAASADVVALTPIAFDHQEYLGVTLEEIAAEKAAIIRPGTMAITAPQSALVLKVIERRAESCGTALRFAGQAVEVLEADAAGRLSVTFKTARDVYERVHLSLPGRHQAINAAVALELAELLRERGFSVPREAIIAGVETAQHPGRLEINEKITPSIIFDGAHNEAGARALREYLDEFIKAPVTLIFGAMRDKDLCEIAATLFPVADRLILTRIENPRAASLDELQRVVPHAFDLDRITFAENVSDALNMGRESTLPRGVICVTGSLYLVGEVKRILAGNEATSSTTDAAR